jgi:hypothetical protein
MLTSASVNGSALSPALSQLAAAAARSAIAPKTTPNPPITVDIMSCLLWVKISRVENNNKAIGAAVAQVMRFPCGNQAGTLRVAIIAV